MMARAHGAARNRMAVSAKSVRRAGETDGQRSGADMRWNSYTPPSGMWLMYADGTGLLTDAMHDGRGADRFPSRRLGHQWESYGKHSRSEVAAACANHSCGAVAESHRASRAFRIGTKGW